MLSVFWQSAWSQHSSSSHWSGQPEVYSALLGEELIPWGGGFNSLIPNCIAHTPPSGFSAFWDSQTCSVISWQTSSSSRKQRVPPEHPKFWSSCGASRREGWCPYCVWPSASVIPMTELWPLWASVTPSTNMAVQFKAFLGAKLSVCTRVFGWSNRHVCVCTGRPRVDVGYLNYF